MGDIVRLPFRGPAGRLARLLLAERLLELERQE